MTFSKMILPAIAVAVFSSPAFAQITATVVERDNHFKPIFVDEELPNLTSTTRFEGKYFKIVKAKEETAISMDDEDEMLRQRAANTYYHLNKARDFWVNEMHSDYVKNMPQITIRLDLINKFSDLGHFQHESIEPQYNDALSVPAGVPMEGAKTPDGKDIAPWGNEIWFRPVKKILSKDLPANGLGYQGNPINQYLSMLGEPVKQTEINRFIQVTLQKMFYPETLQQPYGKSVIGQAGTFLLTTLILEGSKHSDKLFLEKYYYLDTAMIPEIIYHEFSHVAMSDYLALSLSTPMLEGMADYFSTAISGNPHIGSKIKEFSLSMPKNGKNKTKYNPILETNMFANSDFVLSVLWSVKMAFPEIANRLVYDARTRMLTSTADIRHDLIGSLLESCKTICKDPFTDRMKMRDVFEKRGF